MTDGSPTAEAIATRLERWRRTGDMDALWPETTWAKRRAALGAIVAATRERLADRSGAPRLDDAGTDPRTLGIAAFTAGMGPLLGWWAEKGQIEASPAAREVLATHLDHGRRRAALLRGHVARIVGAMEVRGASPILLKGLHTGAEFFPDPATRPAADIDLLVHPSERQRAADALVELGFVEARRTTFAARSEWTHADTPRAVRSLELDHTDNPWCVDLLTDLERWYFRGMRRSLGAAVFGAKRRIDVDGVPVRVLDQPHLTAYLALHAAWHLAHMQVVRLLDLILVTRADARSGRLDWSAVAATLERTGTLRFAYPALKLADVLAPGAIDEHLLRRATAGTSVRMRRVVEKVRRAELGPLDAPGLDTKLVWAHGAKELLMNSTEIVLPSDDGMGGWRVVLSRRLSSIRRALRRPDTSTS